MEPRPVSTNAVPVITPVLGREASIRPRIKNNFGAVVLLVAEHFVHLGGLVEGHPVAHNKAGVDFAALNQFQQRLHVSHHVGLAGLHGQAFIHISAHGHFVDESAIDAGHGNGATFPARHDDLTQDPRTIRLHL